MINRLTNRSGFTIVELMVTVAILGILAALAGPSIDQLARSAKLDSDTEKFQSALAFARSEAIKRSTVVSVVPSATGYTGGWRIITDDGTNNPDCILTAAQGEQVLRVQDPLSASTLFVVAKAPTDGVAIDCGIPPTAANACISYRANGESINTSGGSLAQTMCLRDNVRPTQAFRALTLNSLGQLFVVKVVR